MVKGYGENMASEAMASGRARFLFRARRKMNILERLQELGKGRRKGQSREC